MKDPKSQSKHKSAPEHDSPSRMDRPIVGNPAQRKNQVQSIARDAMTDNLEPSSPHPDPDALEDGNYQPEIAHSQATGHQPTHHVHHDHTTGQSHTVAHGQPCPSCGTGYMG